MWCCKWFGALAGCSLRCLPAICHCLLLPSFHCLLLHVTACYCLPVTACYRLLLPAIACYCLLLPSCHCLLLPVTACSHSLPLHSCHCYCLPATVAACLRAIEVDSGLNATACFFLHATATATASACRRLRGTMNMLLPATASLPLLLLLPPLLPTGDQGGL